MIDKYLGAVSSCFGASYLKAIKRSVARFLIYAATNGIMRLEDISHRTIVDYYDHDEHNSYKTKDAYNNWLRMFLKYLASLGLIRSSIPLMLDKFTIARMIFIDHLSETSKVPSTLQLALSNEFSPHTAIIKTLDEEDLSNINQYKNSSQTGMQLRDSAMILLGLRMGIRASDIVKIKFSDISWIQERYLVIAPLRRPGSMQRHPWGC